VLFSDAVFAIVITLLVLPLAAEVDLPHDPHAVAHRVWEMRPQVMTFAISFLVIGQFWIAHHRLYERIRGVDAGLLWLNLVFLLTVSFMPFPSAVLGATRTTNESFPVVFYAASMTVTSLLLTLLWAYVLHRRLQDPQLTRTQQQAISRRAVATSAVFALSVAVAFLGLWPAVAMWLVVLPGTRMALSRGVPT
jgi:uncharacterized membrane protein